MDLRLIACNVVLFLFFLGDFFDFPRKVLFRANGLLFGRVSSLVNLF